MVTTSLDTYFWMVDRLQIEDDSRNKVNMAKNTVLLSKPFVKRIDNGHYVGRLLKLMYQTFESRTGQQFDVPQEIIDIDPESAAFQATKWQTIFQTVADYGIPLPKQKQEVIMKTVSTDSLLNIIDALFEVDNSPVGQAQASTKRKLDIRQNRSPTKRPNERLNSAIDERSQAEKISLVMSQRKGSVKGQVRNKLAPLNSDRQSVNGLQLSPVKQNKSPSLSSLQQRSPDRIQNSSIVLGREASFAIGDDQLDDVMPKSLDTTRTSVQFVLMSLAMGFQMKPKQAAALLENNHKYLTMLCIRGSKDADFENVKRWYNLLYPSIGHLIMLINTEKKDVLTYGSAGQNQITTKASNAKQNRGKILFKTLNIFKNGFYSRNDEVQLACGMLFNQVIKEINLTQSDIVGDAWDWFTSSTLQPEFKRNQKEIGAHLVGKTKSPNNRAASALFDQQDKDSYNELEQLQFQTGLQAVVYAYETCESCLIFVPELILQFGYQNSVELFSQRMQQQLPSWATYATLCNDIFVQSLNTDLGRVVVEQSGVLKYWLINSLRIAESNNEVPLNDRIASLVFLTEIWLGRPQYVDKNISGAAESVMRILKKAARDVRKTLTVISIELMFRLLEKFALDKHAIAPTIYKTLTFLLVEFYWEIDVRELMLKHFINLYQTFDSIPINILSEPLLKQIEISQYHASSFNVFDFEFFNSLANHKKLTIPSALLLMDSLSKIAMSSVFYHKPAVSIMSTLMMRFKDHNELYEHWKESLRQIMQTLINIQARFAIHRHHLRNEEQNFFNRLALRNKKQKDQVDPSGGRMSDQEYTQVRINEKLIASLIENVIHLENELINNEIKIQLIDTYIGIKTGLKVDCKPINYLLRNFSNKVDRLVDQRMASNPNAATQVPIPFIQELQQIEKDRVQGSLHNPGAVDIYQSGNQKQSMLKMQTNRSLSPIQVQNNKLSPVSVALPLNTPDYKTVKETSQMLYEYKKWEEDWEIKQYQQFIKKNTKLYRELHKVYKYEQNAKKPQAVDRITFADNEKTQDQVNSQSMIKMIKDFKLDNGLQLNYLKQEVNKLVKAVNIHILNAPGDVLELTFDGFVNFMLQYAHQLYQNENLKAYQLIEKLFNRMREHSQFTKLGLTMNKGGEFTGRKGSEILDKSQIQDQQPSTLKKDTERVKVVQYAIPQGVPIKESKKISIEVLDEILAKLFGFHFLEPVVTEKIVNKVVPTIVARQTTTLVMQSPGRQSQDPVLRGKQANLPLSQVNYLSVEAEVAKAAYEQSRKQKSDERSLTSRVNTEGSTIVDSKLQFKAQALNRRAKQFTEGMQNEIIQAPIQDKQNMFEAAEVLMEVIKAVEQNKKALKLDYTPYKLYDLRKRKESKQEPILETIDDIDPEIIRKRKEGTRNQLQKADQYIQGQQQKQQLEQQKIDRQLQRKQEKKAALMDEYVQVQDQINQDGKKKRDAEVKQKIAQDKLDIKNKVEQKQQQAQDEKKQVIKQKIQDYKRDLKQNSINQQAIKEEGQHKEEQSAQLKKQMVEKQLEKHSKYAEDSSTKKQDAIDLFYTWVKSPPISNIVNIQYKKGLFIKFQQCGQIGQSYTGVSQQAWLEFLKQNNVNSMVDPKALIRIHNAQIKEQHEIGDYSQYFKAEVSSYDVKTSGDRELSYGGFVSAMIKVANYRHIIKESKAKFASQRKYAENSEYALVDQSGTAFTDFLKFMSVAEKK